MASLPERHSYIAAPSTVSTRDAETPTLLVAVTPMHPVICVVLISVVRGH